jgi:hypothetical protein
MSYFKEISVRMWTGLIWHWIGFNEHGNKLFFSIKAREFVVTSWSIISFSRSIC